MPQPGCQPQVVWRAILLTKPILMRRRNSRSTYTKQTVVSYEQSKRHSIGLDKAHSECARYASSLSLRLVWKRCPGRGSAANAKNASTPPLDTSIIGFESPTGIGNSTWIVRDEFGQTPFPQTVNSPNTKLPGLVFLPSITPPRKG